MVLVKILTTDVLWPPGIKLTPGFTCAKDLWRFFATIVGFAIFSHAITSNKAERAFSEEEFVIGKKLLTDLST